MQISRLEPVPLRELWPNEAYGFTVWLAENLDILAETLTMDLSLVSREAPAGTFSADILAEDGNGNAVVIENQLERTDHDHLGKLITYLSNLDANTAIWITSEPRPEHKQAVQWLNEFLPSDMAFYLVEIKAYRIDDSSPAPQMTVAAGPSVPSREAGIQKKELAERHRLRLEFWAQLLEQAKTRTQLYSGRSPITGNWLSAGAGKSGLTFEYAIRMNDALVEFYINREEAEENKNVFDSLFSKRQAIEEAFRDQLEWLRQDDHPASWIRYSLPGGGLRDQNRWPKIQEAMIDAMVRLEEALKPHLRQL